MPRQYIRKYSMLFGIISSGVCIRESIAGVKRLPAMVRKIPATIEKARSVCIALSSPFWSRAPKFLEIMTPAPIAIPLKKPTIILIRGDEDDTAASASRPR